MHKNIKSASLKENPSVLLGCQQAICSGSPLLFVSLFALMGLTDWWHGPKFCAGMPKSKLCLFPYVNFFYQLLLIGVQWLMTWLSIFVLGCQIANCACSPMWFFLSVALTGVQWFMAWLSIFVLECPIKNSWLISVLVVFVHCVVFMMITVNIFVLKCLTCYFLWFLFVLIVLALLHLFIHHGVLCFWPFNSDSFVFLGILPPFIGTFSFAIGHFKYWKLYWTGCQHNFF